MGTVIGLDVARLFCIIGAVGMFGCTTSTPDRSGDTNHARPDEPDNSASRSVAATRAQPDGPFTELVGSWHGEAVTAEYGLVTADVSISSDGGLIYTAIGQGLSRTGFVTIEAWTEIGLRVRDGTTNYDFFARRTGDLLVVTLPIVGEVTFARRPTSR